MEDSTNNQGFFQSEKTTSHRRPFTILNQQEQKQKQYPSYELSSKLKNFENENDSRKFKLGPKVSINSQSQISKDHIFMDFVNDHLPPQKRRNASIQELNERVGNMSSNTLKLSQNSMNNSQRISDYDNKAEINAEIEASYGKIVVENQRIGALIHDKDINVNIKQPLKKAGNERAVRNVGTNNKELQEREKLIEYQVDKIINLQEKSKSKFDKRMNYYEIALELQQQKQSERVKNIEKRINPLEKAMGLQQQQQKNSEQNENIDINKTVIEQKLDKLLEIQQRQSEKKEKGKCCCSIF